MREMNVIERLCGSVKKAHTAIVLTHNIDFLFVESVVLPRLRAIGSPQLTIFADAACAASSYQTQETLVSLLGFRYRVVPIDLGQARRFHPKAIFLAGNDGSGLAVGSGNMTYGGWSGNKEIWTDFLVPGSGAAQIASFREYLAVILSYVPDSAAVRAEVLGLFDEPENAWAAALPEPGGLAWTPKTTPMLDQILMQIGGPPTAIEVLSPYFDPEGAALARIAELCTGEVRVMLQPRRAGLSQDIVATLPKQIRLSSIEAIAEDARHKFIHAKVYSFATSADFFVAAGSANCSRAALLADASWGNAEIMAVSALRTEDFEELWSSYALTDSAPELPETHPSEDWTFGTSELRILAARRDGSELTVHYKAHDELSEVSIQTKANVLLKAHTVSPRRADFDINEQVNSVSLVARTIGGRTVTSLPCWIDDERSLRMAPAERVLRDKLEEAAARGSLLGRDFLQILELFEHHVQRDAAHGGKVTKARSDENAIAYFSEADIYAEEFGTPPPSSNSALPVGFSETDELALIYSFFRTPSEPNPKRRPSVQSSDEEKEGEDQKPEAVKRASIDNSELDIQRVRLIRLLTKIEVALQRPEYLQRRKADRVAGDIAFLAVLMAKARADELLDEQSYRAQATRFWRILFFGPKGDNGIIPLFLTSLDEDARATYTANVRSPRLSAAMSLWCTFDWTGAETDAQKFRFSTALLASRYRWLAEGGDQATLVEELHRLAEKLFPASRYQDLFDAWVRWVRDGHAIAALYAALGDRQQGELAKLCVRPAVSAGELTWQAGHGLCVLHQGIARVPTKAQLLPLDGSDTIRVQSKFVAPLIDILQSDIELSDRAKHRALNLLIGARLG
ncbi:hypothetical protein [Bradyrhizobium sp. SZCCHNPS1003]|uniref:hypothetical protein n=1 Tax=Bradyrhizobium sp. SZCCHNPS1003 TaxID=3057330 RepID=UPI0028E96E26|nr:hypothetical protein [Bradyrhizobium sp. SZCCHNPS1003]